MVGRNLIAVCAAVCLCVTAYSERRKSYESVDASTTAPRLGYGADSRLLVIDAEDLGMAHSVDEATFDALEKGWVTSASVLVPAPWFPEVAGWAREHRNADLGIQLDLNADWVNYRWRPVSPQAPGSSLVDDTGYMPLTEPYVIRHAVPDEVDKEVHAQVNRAEQAGIHPAFLDTHMRAMMLTPALFRIYWQLGQQFKLPILLQQRQVKAGGKPEGNGEVYSFGGVDVDLRQVPVDGITLRRCTICGAATFAGAARGLRQLSMCAAASGHP